MTLAHELPAEAPYDEPDDLGRQLDDMVDKRGYSYDDARRELGIVDETAAAVPEVVAPERMAVRMPHAVSSATRSRRARAAIGGQLGEEAGVGYPGGVPFEHQPRVILSADQLATNARGLGLARATLAAARNKKQ
jgi:hypothetical protein